jgi:hypothetical protein
MDDYLELKALEIATENMGIYPKAVTNNGVTKKRTEWQDGWNEAVISLTRKAGDIKRYIDALPEDVKDFIIQGKIRISDNDGISMYINCNDLFYWACADEEEFTLDDLNDLKKAYLESPENGDILWACRKRGMRPQTPFYKLIDKSEHSLFNACGGERNDH